MTFAREIICGGDAEQSGAEDNDLHGNQSVVEVLKRLP
jgi:hypothetical protein